MYCPALRVVDIGSFMTGRRPDTTKVWEFDDHFRESGPGTANGVSWQSLPQYFKQRGYVVLGRCAQTADQCRRSMAPDFEAPVDTRCVHVPGDSCAVESCSTPSPRQITTARAHGRWKSLRTTRQSAQEVLVARVRPHPPVVHLVARTAASNRILQQPVVQQGALVVPKDLSA
jgi:hypothetical protein